MMKIETALPILLHEMLLMKGRNIHIDLKTIKKHQDV